MMKLRNIFSGLIVIFLVSIFNPMTSFAQTNYIYWINTWVNTGANKMQRANLDGSNVQDILTGFKRPVGIALDLAGGKLYWTDRDSSHYNPNSKSSIHRANLDGSNIEPVIITDLPVIEAVALDVSEGKIYWTSWSREVNNANKIQRANLDGSNIETLVTGLSVQGRDTGPRGIALDISEGKMYWAYCGADKIQRANLDGSNVETLITGSGCPHHLALDFNSRKLYWTEWHSNRIQRANLDGSGIEFLVGGLENPGGIALDSINGKMYWTTRSKIQRANLNGTNLEDLVTGVNAVGIALSIPQSNTRVPSRVNLNFTMPSEVSVGEELTATLNVTNAVDLAGVQLDLHFNPAVLEATDIQEGDLLAGTGTFFQVLHLATVPGEISGIRIARIGGVEGSGTLLKVVFKAKGVGVSELAARNLKLGTPAGTAIPANVVSGKVEVGSRPDVTGDGKVNILDLVLVSRHFGPAAAAPPGADINGDGEVDILDIIVLAQHLSTANTAAAPALIVEQTRLDAVTVQGWLSATYVENDGSLALAHGIANLEALLARIVPTEIAVYANYPNPFNPETWLPYQLADAADVTFRIYSASGHLVRTLVLGHQAAGLYQSRSRAAYWDGRDALGEPVASGVYFYTLTAGDFIATRKMLIRK